MAPTHGAIECMFPVCWENLVLDPYVEPKVFGVNHNPKERKYLFIPFEFLWDECMSIYVCSYDTI